MRRQDLTSRLASLFSSMELTVFCLIVLMILTVACTLAQVNLGVHMAVEQYVRSFFVWWRPEFLPFAVPVFPGGGLAGGLLLLNLGMVQFRRLEFSWRKAGLWIIHFGMALLFLGEFAAAFLQVESHLTIEEGQTMNYSQDARRMELAVVDATDGDADDVRSIPTSMIKERAEITDASLPFALRVQAYYENAELSMRGPGDPASPATAGVGTGVLARPAPRPLGEEQDMPAALIEPVARDGRSYGVFLLSPNLGAPQEFVHEGRRWRMSLRPKRYYMPFSLTLKDFKHDVYPGTRIPKNFSSLVRLLDPRSRDDRDVLIYMNSPLRHGGLTFYQASFGKNDTLSVLQVVRNPSWTLPYISCALVAVGLLWHFGMMLRRTLGGLS
ncbi:MAG: cytochrome c biogenesis protein ResB [Elusimicrobia bacterium]|nr:cytochrome c biogenesis protein ResB [Elusimicrobiota bacterium]